MILTANSNVRSLMSFIEFFVLLFSFFLFPFSFDEARQRIGHPGFRPTHIRNAHLMKTPALVKETSALVAQVFDRPSPDLFRQNHRARNMSAQLEQSYYC